MQGPRILKRVKNAKFPSHVVMFDVGIVFGDAIGDFQEKKSYTQSVYSKILREL